MGNFNKTGLYSFSMLPLTNVINMCLFRLLCNLSTILVLRTGPDTNLIASWVYMTYFYEKSKSKVTFNQYQKYLCIGKYSFQFHACSFSCCFLFASIPSLYGVPCDSEKES